MKTGAPIASGPLLFLALLVVSVVVTVACGAGTPSESAAPAAVDQNAVSLVTRPDRTYTVQDMIDAGWKKSKEFDPANLPGATAAIFGFYNQKDIELWFYPSHSGAVERGVAPAEQAIARKPGQTDYLIPQTNRYHAYAVVGNVVMLCEFELADCQALIARLP